MKNYLRPSSPPFAGCQKRKTQMSASAHGGPERAAEASCKGFFLPKAKTDPPHFMWLYSGLILFFLKKFPRTNYEVMINYCEHVTTNTVCTVKYAALCYPTCLPEPASRSTSLNFIALPGTPLPAPRVRR